MKLRESAQSMAKPEYLTAPLKTDKMPPGVPFIIGNEAAERFSFYGMNSILVVFMTKHLRDATGTLDLMTAAQAETWYHDFLAWVYLLPILGAVLADAVWGKYRTILWVSIIYCLGHLALALDHTRLGLFFILVVVFVFSLPSFSPPFSFLFFLFLDLLCFLDNFQFSYFSHFSCH